MDMFDVKKIIEFETDQLEVCVTNANKRQFVKKMAQRITTLDIELQIEAFIKGFRSIIPQKEATNLTRLKSYGSGR